MRLFKRNTKAKLQPLLQKAIELENSEQMEEAIQAYNKIIELNDAWDTPHYNLGLIYKYTYDWTRSFYHNKRAVELDSSNVAAWWNLGIAATALQDWKTATWAWVKAGVNMEITDKEPDLNFGNTPIRLNPDEEAEVVWAKRIDPARAVILNVPLASCKHRYGDMVLNDGAPVGYRISDGNEYPVFNELQLIKPSKYKTYSCIIKTTDEHLIEKLDNLGEQAGVEIENWSAMRILCKQCSEGIPHEHHDVYYENANETLLGIAALNETDITNVLNNWQIISGADFRQLELEFE